MLDKYFETFFKKSTSVNALAFINTHITYVLLVDLTPPIGILLTITDEFLGISALSSVYSVNKESNFCLGI